MYQVYTYEFVSNKTGNIIKSLTTKSANEEVINQVAKRLELDHNTKVLVNRLELVS